MRNVFTALAILSWMATIGGAVVGAMFFALALTAEGAPGQAAAGSLAAASAILPYVVARAFTEFASFAKSREPITQRPDDK